MLRNPGVQKLKSRYELVEYCCRSQGTSQVLEQYLYTNQGSNLVIVLDGYDETSENVKQNSLIANIIHRRELPKCTLVISSRPISTGQLHGNMDCRVEILGFTNSDRQKFIQDSFKNAPEKIPVLQEYLNKNSLINTFCYIPLVMTILLCLFKASIKLPETQTELYEKFICHTIVHYLKKHGRLTYPSKSIRSLSDIEQPYKDIIHNLAKVSFTLLADDKIVFTANDVKKICPDLDVGSKDCTELGLLRATQYLDIEEITPVMSYNFLHLSIQEFLAAWYISSLWFWHQKEILQRLFWSTRYFNTWIMYMGLTKGQNNSFKYFISGSVYNFIHNRYAMNFIISNRILVEKVKCLHLFQCFLEAKNDKLCALVGSFFEDLVIDLSGQTLLPKDMHILCLFLLRSKNSEWYKLDLSGCNIGDIGCGIMHKSLIIGKKHNSFFLHLLDLSKNHLTSSSAAVVIDLVQSFKVVELNISDNPLQNLPLESLCKCKHLKSLITGSDDKHLNDREIKATLKNIISQSALQYVSIKNSSGSSLIFNKGDFRIVSFSLLYSSSYSHFVMRNCKITKRTHEDLCTFILQNIYIKYCYISNNEFDESTILSICSILAEKSHLQEIVISENCLTSTTIAKIITILSSFAHRSVMVYSQCELQVVGVLFNQVVELLAKQPGLTKLNIVNYKESNSELPVKYFPIKKIPNAIEEFKFYTNAPDSFAYFAKALNYSSIKIFHVNKANITDDIVIDIAATLSYNKTLAAFDISHSTLTINSANTIIGALTNTSTLGIFNISNCGITDEMATNIAVVLKNNFMTLTKVDISNNKLTSIGAISIFEALKDSCNLETFKINGNRITDEAVKNITEILLNNSHLVEVDVTMNQFSPIVGRNIITTLENNTFLKIFNIGDCRITEEVAAKIAIIITANPSLIELDLSGSHLTASAAQQIVQALGHIRNLRLFKACKHMITKNTVNDAISVLSCNTELVDLDISFSLLTSGAIKLIRSLQNKPLKILKMSNCKVTKSEADEIGDIFKTAPLVELDLSDNPDLAAIGATIIFRALKSTELSTLQVLNLRNCGITDKATKDFIVALTTVTNLRELDISYNQYTSDSILKIFAALRNTQIQVLKVNGCIIFWSIKEPNEVTRYFPNMTKLHHLELSDTNFLISSILNCTSTLEIVDISRCLHVNDEEAKALADGISSNPNLRKLDISYNDLTTSGVIQISKALQNTTGLQSFAINNCKIRDNATQFIAAVISHNPQLVELNISWNALTAVGVIRIIQSLTYNNHLQVLKAAGCGLTEREADELAKVLSDKTGLKELDLSWNELKADGVNVVIKALSAVVSLQVLKIDNCNIADKAVGILSNNLAKYYALTELDISHNNFTAAGIATVVESLKALSNLIILKLSSCILDEGSSNTIASAIGNNCNLSHFELYHSHFTTVGTTSFSQHIASKIHILQVLKLVNCSITDKECHEIATILKSNETIEHLDLSHNPLGEGVMDIIRVLQGNEIIKELLFHSCSITDKATFDIARFARSTMLREFNILQNQLTIDGAVHIAKGFMDSTTLKVLKIKDWSEIFRCQNYEDDNYVLATLQRNKVSLILE